MTTIALEGIHFIADHGYYPEEQELGNHFVLDVYVKMAVNLAGRTDDLRRTVNYETIYLICQAEMKKSSQLLEKLAQAIADRINEFFELVQSVKVRVRKLNPPLAGRVDSAYVEVEVGGSGGMGGLGGGGGGRRGGFLEL